VSCSHALVNDERGCADGAMKPALFSPILDHENSVVIKIAPLLRAYVEEQQRILYTAA
jgi:hypothetical protein